MKTPQIQPVFEDLGDYWQIGYGLTPVTAAQYLAQEFPDIPQWVCWNMDPEPAERALRAFVGQGANNAGTIGKWSWERIPCRYGNVGFWSSRVDKTHIGSAWVGMLQVTGPKGEQFYMFSYIRIDCKPNMEYLVSTGDLKLLRRFAEDVLRHLQPRRNRKIVNVQVIGSTDFQLRADEMEEVYLPARLQEDILTQVDGFFGSKKLYREMEIPYKRGFLFTGQPGTGKTMLIRNLIRHCYSKHKVSTAYLAINRRTDAMDLRALFRCATDKNPCLLILEDVESLCHETMLTRSEVLAELDGISQHSGMLLIATANDPGRIDPALVHRPSRFDRVWTFPLPDKGLRSRYIREQYPRMDAGLLERLAAETEDWTFAYIKEMRNTAAILAIKDGLNVIEPHHVTQALTLLRDQFKAGKSGHKDTLKSNRPVGFDFSTR
ncbi:MAG TPA: ATP-binding protein [Kiritimatiellia bacterium]|nr:ATP-binding protein [Kiritimatiellia bacterium]